VTVGRPCGGRDSIKLTTRTVLPASLDAENTPDIVIDMLYRDVSEGKEARGGIDCGIQSFEFRER